MTLLFCDGFDTADWANKWSIQTLTGSATMTASTNTPFTVGKSVSFSATNAGTGNTSKLIQTIPPNVTIYVGFAINVQARPGSTDVPIIRLAGDSGTTPHVSLMMPQSGALYWRRETLAALGALATPMTDGRWYYVEAKITMSDTVGEVTTRVDGNLDSSLTNIDTKNAGTLGSYDTVTIGTSSNSSAAGGAYLIDDFYICDTAGTRNNTFLGPIRIQTLSPNGPGADGGLTPLSGSNYQNASDQNPATYNFSATAGTRDSYALPDLAAGTTSVLAVRNVLAGQNSDAGAGGFKPVVRSGGTVYYDPTVTLGATNKVYSQAVRDTDPATSAPWTVSAVNALQVGAEVS